MSVFILKQYPENFVFRIVRFRKLFARKVGIFMNN